MKGAKSPLAYLLILSYLYVVRALTSPPKNPRKAPNSFVKMLSFCAAALAVPLNQQVATLDHAVALKQIRQDVGFEDSATQQITVHGQPIFRFGKNHENATRLWLPTGVLKTLLTWEAPGGKTLSLVGKTFHPRHNNSRGVKKTDQVPTLLHLVAALNPPPPPPLYAPLAVV